MYPLFSKAFVLNVATKNDTFSLFHCISRLLSYGLRNMKPRSHGFEGPPNNFCSFILAKYYIMKVCFTMRSLLIATFSLTLRVSSSVFCEYNVRHDNKPKRVVSVFSILRNGTRARQTALPRWIFWSRRCKVRCIKELKSMTGVFDLAAPKL